MKLRKINALVFIILFFASSVSCGIKATEVKDRMIIECIGIDYDEETAEYMLSVQVFNTNPMGIKGGETPEEVTKIYESNGQTIAEAMNNITQRLGKEIMNSHNRLIVFGKSTADRGIVEAMDYFIRDYTSRALVHVAVAESSAREIVVANYGKDVLGAKILGDLLSKGSVYSAIPAIYVYEVVNRLNDETADFYVPIINLQKTEGAEEEEVVAHSDSTAIFKGDKMVGKLNAEETQGLMWVNGIMEKGGIILAPEADKRFSLSIINVETKYKVSEKDGKPAINIEIYCSCDIVEYMNKDFANIDTYTMNLAKTAAEEQIIEFSEAAIDKAALELGSDVFRFGRRIWLFKPKLFRRLEDDWENNLKNISTSISAEVSIRLVGQEAVGNI